MEHKAYKLFDAEEFERLSRGVKVAQCMRIDGSTDSQNDVENQRCKLEELCVSDKLYCSYCCCPFDSQTQQRLHYKLDWHRYNLKQSLLDRKPVTEESFSQLADLDDVSSISGSESDSEGEDTEEDPVKRIPGLLPSRHSKVFFENSDGKIFSVYRCLLHGKKDALERDDQYVSKVLKVATCQKWAIFMLGGGHFAAAIFNGREVVAHKTFHCYTVRKGQGGTQSSRDNKSGSSHPKSAGASLRRYNEAALTQHVQDITAAWSPELSSCDLVFYRAAGHNVAVLFGGRNPPLEKNDPRLRTIPFPTRRATFSEVKRVQDVLATVEVYGFAESYQNSFPQSPRKKPTIKPSDAAPPTDTNELSTDRSEVDESTNNREQTREVRPNRAKSREVVDREVPGATVNAIFDSDESDGSYGVEDLDVEMDLGSGLAEYEDTVPQAEKNRRRARGGKKAKAKDVGKEDERPEVRNLCNVLVKASSMGDLGTVVNVFGKVAGGDGGGGGGQEDGATSGEVTPDEVLECLNKPMDSLKNTLLHIASLNGHIDIIRYLLETGADPGVKNKKGQTPYVVATVKEARNVFRRFLAEFPEKYDYSGSQIPGGLTEEMEQEQAEKRRAMKKAKREKVKEKIREEEVKKVEAMEKERFLKLTDREKRALAAERRMVSATLQSGGAAPVVARCFRCATDISGKVPFEYDIHRFCSIACLKAHRMANKSSVIR